jgi:acyl-CoA hydrolase
MKPKKAQRFQNWNIVFPNDANSLETMFGGRLMAMMDEVGAIAASNYAQKQVVTVSTDAILFKKPVRIGDRINTQAKVVWVGRSSMIVKLDVFAENTSVGRRREHCTTAHFTYVALDMQRKPTVVPPLKISSEREKKEYDVAKYIKKQALERASIENKG